MIIADCVYFRCSACGRLTHASRGGDSDEWDPNGDKCDDCWYLSYSQAAEQKEQSK